MANKEPIHRPLFNSTDLPSSDRRGDLGVLFDWIREEDTVNGDHVWTLGAFAGLLIAKWAGCDAALGRPIADGQVENHARELVRAVWTTDGAAGAAVRVPVVAAAQAIPAVYRAIVDWVRCLDLGDSKGRVIAASALDDALRLLVSQHGKDAGIYVTPKRVADLMVELANPGPGDSVYDPCFGFGGLLAEAACWLSAALPFGSARPLTFFGVEKDPITYAIGWCRLALAGVDCHGLAHGDSLEPGAAVSTELPISGRWTTGFDCILAVPPWGRNVDYQRPPSDDFPIRGGSIENLFLQHVMARLRPGGRAVVAVPDRLLSRDGPDREVRESLMANYCVEAVVALPAGALTPYTSLPMNLVRFSRSKPQSAVRFVNLSSTIWETSASDADGSGRGTASEAGLADGSGYGAGSHADESRFGNSSASRHELFRAISDLIRHTGDLSDYAAPLGMDVWEDTAHELSLRGYELVAKNSGRKRLDAELARLARSDRSLRIERLEKIGEISTGLSYRRDVVTERPKAAGAVTGLLRVADVTDEGIRPPSRYLVHEAKVNGTVPEMPVLQAGDLVVTTSGTVGRVAVITGSMSSKGLLATRNLAVIRVSEEIRPEFLAALLQSPAYRNWLLGHARGTTIQQLPLPALGKVKIPIPPLALQDAVLDESRGPGADALAALARMASGRKKRHPLALWLETPFAARLATGRPDDDFGIESLSSAMSGLRSLGIPEVESTAPESNERAMSTWLVVARKAATALDGVEAVPPGAGLLAILESARARLHESFGILDGAKGSTIRRLRSLTRAMLELVEREAHAMQHDVSLVIDLKPTEVEAGVTSEIRVIATNASAVPLRSVEITVRGPVGTVAKSEIPYLSEQAKHEVPLVVKPKDPKQPLRIAVAWRVRRLDGTTVQDATEVAATVHSSGRQLIQGDLGASPYIVGSPVEQREMFFGRSEVMDQIKRQLGAQSHANVILLEGNRRTGKTSILRQIEMTCLLEDWIPIYCSLQAAESVATRDVFRLLALRTGWTLHDSGVETWFPELAGPDPCKPFKLAFRSAVAGAFVGDNVFEMFQLYLAAAVAAASPRRILFMLDEFDRLEEGIAAGIASPRVPENIRHLLQHQPGVCAIITGSRRLKRLREEYWSALFGLGYRVGISQLPIADAKRLVTEPVARRIRYLPRASDLVVDLCARHPFLIQSLCNRVFVQAATTGERTITPVAVERAADEMVRDNEHFRTLWGYAGSVRRKLLLALCDRLSEETPEAVNLDLLETKLGENGVALSRTEDLADDIRELRELELLEFGGRADMAGSVAVAVHNMRLINSYGYQDSEIDYELDQLDHRVPRASGYRIAVPLMARWMRLNVDFDDLVTRARQEAEE